jgi:hypothetical protein
MVIGAWVRYIHSREKSGYHTNNMHNCFLTYLKFMLALCCFNKKAMIHFMPS